MAKIVGIDLGTTKSAIAVWDDGAPQIIPDSEGRTVLPSIVAWNAIDGQWEVGHSARAMAIENPAAAIYSIKRLIGRRFKEDVVQKNLERLRILYDVEESRRQRDGIEVILSGKRLTPQEVSAKILQKLKANAETSLGHEIDSAVITVPAYFHDSQRQATRDAGNIAGLNVKRVLNEPTAACLAFGFKKLNEARRTVAVYDLGGGTFDISILEVGRGPFWVRATNGDTYLGGDDLNWLIVEWVLNEIGGEEKNRLRQDVHALSLLRAEAERAKVGLSSSEITRIQVPGQLPMSGIRDLDLELTRSRLEAIAIPFIAKTLEPCARALHDARLKTVDIQEVLLVGGQTRMPAIRQAVRDFFGVEPNTSINPEEVVALGAAVQAAILAGEATGLKLADVVPLSLGVDTERVMDVLIPRNTPVPFEKTKIYSTVADNQESVEIQIYQGERPMAASNVKLGSFYLRGIGPAPAGEPEIEVTFRVDQDGILHVTGKDLCSGSIKEITITDSVRLSKEEIETMIREAREHEAEYADQRRQTEAHAQVERLVQRLNELLVEKRDALSPEVVAAIREALTVLPVENWVTRLAELQDLWRRTLLQI